MLAEAELFDGRLTGGQLAAGGYAGGRRGLGVLPGLVASVRAAAGGALDQRGGHHYLSETRSSAAGMAIGRHGGVGHRGIGSSTGDSADAFRLIAFATGGR